VKHSVKHTNKKDLQCPKCPFKANRNFVLRSHVASHDKGRSFQCDKCDKKFKNRHNLKAHYKSLHFNHSSSKKQKIKCDYCKYETESKSYLKLHERRHTGEKPEQCPECGKKFSRKFVLVSHCQRLHSYSKQDLIKSGMYSEMLENQFQATE
jgi:KRAB domain-containing zinc finger protein